MIKKILFTFLTVAIFSVYFLGINPVEARMIGRNGVGMGIMNVDPDLYSQKLQDQFNYWSKISGIDVNKIKNYWGQGKNFKEILELEKVNLTDVQNRMREFKLEQIKKNLQSLVAKGIITQDQANQRLEWYRSKLGQNQNILMKGLGGKGPSFIR